jgi:hypothetical protein
MEPVTLGLLGLALLVVLAGAAVVLRNRPFTTEVPVFRASRLTGGNRWWPTQVAVFPDRVVRYTPRLFGHFEETISTRQVASVSVDAGLFFGDVIIETTGGSQPIRCHGHRKRDAEEIRRRISAAEAPSTSSRSQAP